MERLIVETKREKPHWGARKIRELLVRHLAGDVWIPARHYRGLSNVDYPFHDQEIMVTSCGRLCMHRKKINISITLAGQKLGIKEVKDGIWLVSFMDYDLGYIDLVQKTLQTIDNPFGPKM